MVADASVSFMKMETNQHLAEFDIEVLPEYRGQRIARNLFERVVDAARMHGRTLLMTKTTERIPAGTAFM